jgi:hypothetical protein
LRTLSADRAASLRKARLPKIREQFLDAPTPHHLIVVDRQHTLGTIDAEVGNLILLPSGAAAESDQIELVEERQNGVLYRAVRPGLARVTLEDEEWAAFARVSRYQYAGLAQYRHLEETAGD